MPMLNIRVTSYDTNEDDQELAEEAARYYFLDLLGRHDWRAHLIVQEVEEF